MRHQDDLEAYWGIDHKGGDSLKDSKLRIELSATLSWPKYATYKEDYLLRNKAKWSRFNGSRPIFWDMTNVSAVQYSSTSLQHVTHSDYYGENFWKGGVGIQLCGWLLVGLLWGGGVSDSDYNNNEGYLDDQTKFAEKDRVGEDEKLIPFTSILDKG